MHKVIICVILVFIWMLVIFNFSNMNTKKSNGKSKKIIYNSVNTCLKVTNKINLTNVNTSIKANELTNKLNLPLRKCAHATVYFVLGIVAFISLRYLGINHSYLISIIFCFLYACTDEIHQKFVPGRTSSFKDVLIDSLGCILGLLLVYIVNNIIIKE